MRTSYHNEDVVLLLKDITGLVRPQPTKERERLIQAGRHYCEMLPVEYMPSETYLRMYEEALDMYAQPTADAVAVLSEKIIREKGADVVLVSLARAGIPIGILIKRYLKWRYGMTVPHYAVSIIRGRGIDHNAMRVLLERYEPKQLQFVDGWIGKGAILNELKKETAAFAGVSADLAVLADPAHLTRLYGTAEDILIPSSCLNSTVCGLISRTFLRDDVIGPDDFHGAAYYGEWKDADLSYAFLEAIQARFRPCTDPAAEQVSAVRQNGRDEVRKIAAAFAISDINRIKPGIGETTRVLLRRVPWKILAGCPDSPQLRHICRLAQEKGIEVIPYPLACYQCCGIIRNMADA